MIHQIHCHGYLLATCIYDDQTRKYYVFVSFHDFSGDISRGYQAQNYADKMVRLHSDIILNAD